MQGINISLQNYAKLCTDLNDINASAEKAITRTVSDFKSRAPAWVSAAVADEYTIKKSEVKEALAGSKKSGTIKVAGVTIDNIGLVYEGSALTPTHFKMKPKNPTAKREKGGRLIPGENLSGFNGEVATIQPIKAYQVTAEIHKGKAKNLGPSVFLGSNRAEGYIPFQRTGSNRTPIEAIKTVSIPQMITNEKVAEDISQNIEEGMLKRLEHHVEQMAK